MERFDMVDGENENGRFPVLVADQITGVGKVSCPFLYSVTHSSLLADAGLHRI